ncbi:hypothetical protein M2132_000498 [Dysgonomonas sp. PH5-45]|uniref:hypothetical protein n=1 Tax=unclassified Dysgonomonas TaxID=2630389 RepID=UPI00247729F6|nr:MULTISPECIES: hypothetical protein [unclassified Dysgonomonas]MDH6354176.1 hypothetical protein [Dysgonomonas sp. PH5-45]MDH6386973.1 hypothetical protein [Dysgonomonas sp. PH5-37]
MKNKQQTKLWLLLCLTFVLSCASTLKAQVTIGSDDAPNTNAILDLKQTGTTTKGLLLPRVTLTSTTSASPMTAHVAGMTVYNLEPKGTGATQVYAGFYYNDGTKWVRLVPENTIFFYAPSIVVPTETTASEYNSATQTFTLDLYSIYQSQFGLTDGTTSAKSPTAGTLPVMAKEQLGYFVTYYDKAVFTNVAINNNGILTYKLASGFTITEKTFMNVVFKVK